MSEAMPEPENGDREKLKLIGQNEKLKNENQKLWKLIKEQAEVDENELALIEALHELIPSRPEVPPAKARKLGKMAIRASGILDIGDVHYGELVTERSTGGLAHYSPEIARKRFDYTIDEAIRLGELHKVDKLLVILGGDMISGNIHDDLERSNEIMPIEQTLQCGEMLYNGLEKLCQVFSGVDVVGVSGNHARLYRQPFYNRKQIENLDYVLYKILEHKGRDQSNLNFYTPESFWAIHEVEGRDFLIMHGDTNRQQNSMGISYYSVEREAKKWLGMVADGTIPHFDDIITHHLHTAATIPVGNATVRINGSLKGKDDYSFAGTRPPAPASQRFLTVEKGEVMADYLIKSEDIK